MNAYGRKFWHWRWKGGNFWEGRRWKLGMEGKNKPQCDRFSTNNAQALT
jgi:hypothetical protein